MRDLNNSSIEDRARELRNEYQRQYKAKNRDKINEYNKQWRANNKDKVKEYENRYWVKKALEEKSDF